VDNPAFMGREETSGNLPRDPQSTRNREPAVLTYQLGQVPPRIYVIVMYLMPSISPRS
jgi:hypothetical protein